MLDHAISVNAYSTLLIAASALASAATTGFVSVATSLLQAVGEAGKRLDFWQEPAFDHYYSDHGHQAYGHMVLKSVEDASSQGDAATVRARFTLNDPSNREEVTRIVMETGGVSGPVAAEIFA